MTLAPHSRSSTPTSLVNAPWCRRHVCRSCAAGLLEASAISRDTFLYVPFSWMALYNAHGHGDVRGQPIWWCWGLGWCMLHFDVVTVVCWKRPAIGKPGLRTDHESRQLVTIPVVRNCGENASSFSAGARSFSTITDNGHPQMQQDASG